MAFLTSRTLASGVTGEDLFHIVITGDTSQNSAGSSYKAKINQILGLMTSEPTVFSSGVTANTVTIGGTTLLESDGLCLKKLCISDTFGTVKDVVVNDVKIGRGEGDWDKNTTVGKDSLTANTTGQYLTTMGKESLMSNTIGNDNSAFGYNALKSNMVGNDNTSFGSTSLILNDGDFNTALGSKVLFTNSNGSYNTSIGGLSLYSNTSGSDNVALGYTTLAGNTVGISNTSVGNFSLAFNINGNNNVALGMNAGYTNISGDDNTFIGAGADCSSGNLTNATAIGSGAIVSQSGSIVLGNGFASVGINTSAPTSKLHVVGDTGYNQFRMEVGFTPSGTTDTNGNVGDVAWDDDYIYLKTFSGWGRTQLVYGF